MSSPSKRLTVEIQKFCGQAEQERHKVMVMNIVQHLQKDITLLDTVHNLIQAGAFGEKLSSDSGRFHRSAVRFNDLSVATLMDVFRAACPQHDAVQLKKACSEKRHLHRVMTYAFGIDANDKLCSKVKSACADMLRQRHELLGSRLLKLKFNIDNQVDWEKCGVFTMDLDSGKIVHISGAIASVPMGIQLSEQCKIEKNWSDAHAQLIAGLGVTLQVNAIFNALSLEALLVVPDSQ